jgi:hypothetical protein
MMGSRPTIVLNGINVIRKATKTRRKECGGHHYAQTNTYNINKT